MTNKRKKRVKLGRTIEHPRTYERNIMAEEKINGSPYWAWAEKHGQNEEGDITEPAQANPDVLAMGEMGQTEGYLDEENIKDVLNQVLTTQQAQIMTLVVEGYSQPEIARNLAMKQGYVSRVIKAARIKLQEYF